MVYGVEAILPSDIEYDSPRVREHEEEAIEERRKDDIDVKEEACLLTMEQAPSTSKSFASTREGASGLVISTSATTFSISSKSKRRTNSRPLGRDLM